MTNAFWSILGYAAALLLAMIPVGGMILLTKTKAWRRRKGIRPAGWAPWWYVGGQPEVPEELQEGTEAER
ncbi:MAG TPA: hypothetical protein VMQ78_03945 [Candidatus Limnocylindria bacterium]|nr:hypothetical protein [Candidatus Limnocylindria bacterium]